VHGCIALEINMNGYTCFQLIARLFLIVRNVSVNNNSHPQGDFWRKEALGACT
jgi:hypothetical protein